MYAQRVKRVVEGMERLGLRQLLVSATESVYYLTGMWIKPGKRMLALTVDAGGTLTVYAHEMFGLEARAPGVKTVTFADTDQPTALLARDLKPGRLGVDKEWPSLFLIQLMKARPDIEMTVGSAAVDDARMRKDAAELEGMRASSRMNDQVLKALIETLKEGETEREVARRYEEMAVRLGASGSSFTPLVCFGANCAEPHHDTGEARLKRGDAVILDLGLELNRMMSDMTRTVFFGAVTEEQRRVYETVRAAGDAAKAMIRPGVTMQEIDAAARGVITEAGYGPQFLHRTGHGIGLSVHEPPDVSAACAVVAEVGMTFSVEPGIYLPGKFGVRIEDLVTVTPDGCEVLNRLERTLRVLGG